MIIQYLNSQRKYKLASLKYIVENSITKTLRHERINEFLTKNAIEPVFSITFTNNENIRKINKTYRNIDKSTDVLSFPMFEEIVNDANDAEFTKVYAENFTNTKNDANQSVIDNDDNNKIQNACNNKRSKILTRIPKTQIFTNDEKQKEANFGDIVISLEKAFEQSQEYGHSFEREVAFLTVHSVLHLIGYDHIDVNDEKKMIKKQKQIMADF